jgi:competence protein ComEA
MRRLLAIIVPMMLAPMLLAPVLAWADPVNINSADAATLARELKGVGPAKAQAIVQYRQQHGAFRSADELALVKGIGPKFIERNRAQIRVDQIRVDQIRVDQIRVNAARRPAAAVGSVKSAPAVPPTRPAR